MTWSPRSFEHDGFAVVDAVVPPDECDAVADGLGAGIDAVGSRGILRHRPCVALIDRLRGHPVVGRSFLRDSVAVQCTWFEKSSSRNWLVPMHQDLSIPVAERLDHPALRGWACKEGVHFVQPPVEVLEQLVAVRLHLDRCAIDDGPLRVVPGSHRRGRLASHEAAALRRARGDEPCLVAAGDALVLRPLLLHASSKSTTACRRRVLHFLFGPTTLPFGLRWADAH